MIDAFREGGGEGKPVSVQVHQSWAEDEDTALAIAHDQWRTSLVGPELAWTLELPAQFDEATRFVRPDDIGGPVLVSADPSRLAAWLIELSELGADALYLHHVGQEQEGFIDMFGEKVLPEVTSHQRTAP